MAPRRADLNTCAGFVVAGPRTAGMDPSMSYASVQTAATPVRGARIVRRAAALAIAIFFVAGLSGCNKLKARDLLNKGVASFKAGQYDAAVEDFKQAKELDPDLMNARLYL